MHSRSTFSALKLALRHIVNDVSNAITLARVPAKRPGHKRVCHLGAWHGNMGDAVLLLSIEERLQRAANDQGITLEFVPLNVQFTKIDKRLVGSLNRKFDLVLIGGGGLFLHKPESRSRSGWQLDITPPEIEQIKVPMVVYGIGYNQFSIGNDEPPSIADEVLCRLSEKASLFSVRDQGSFDAFVARGVTSSKLTIIPDPAMWLEGEPISIPGLETGKCNIGLNLAADRLEWRYPAPAKDHAKQWTAALAQALKAVLSQYDGAVYYIPHMLGTDTLYTETLQQELGEKFHNIGDLLPYLFPPRLDTAKRFVGVYEQMSLVLGMRGHANIIPFGTGTPVIAVSSHNKNRFFMEQIGMAEFVLDTSKPVGPDTALRIQEMVLKVLKEADIISQSYKERKEELSKVADAFDHSIINILKR